MGNPFHFRARTAPAHSAHGNSADPCRPGGLDRCRAADPGRDQAPRRRRRRPPRRHRPYPREGPGRRPFPLAHRPPRPRVARPAGDARAAAVTGRPRGRGHPHPGAALMLSGGDVLSSDELYAAAHLAGLAPSPVFGTGWGAEELGVAAAVAVRGLLSRGLATPDGPALTPDARSALDPLLDPRSLLEIRRDEGPGGRRRYVLGESGARRVLATER